MKCHQCGTEMNPIITDLPFKISETTIVILKGLPVTQCFNCTEYLFDDPVMEKVDEILSTVDSKAELEIIKFAA